MRKRDAILVSLFLFTLLLGGLIFLDETNRETITNLRSMFVQDYLSPGLWTRLSEWIALIANKIAILWRTLSMSKDLLFFGGIMVFGTVILALVLRTTTKTPHNKIESLLKALVEEKERAENLVQLKSEFLNQVSHELRTPLAVITGYLECIMDGLYGQFETKHKEILKAVSKQSNDLKNMIDQILVFSRLEAGKDKVRVEEFPISKIVNDLKDTYEFLGRQKGIEVKWEVESTIPPVNSDPDMKGKYFALLFLLILGTYISLTLYLFASSHPCGILEARMRANRIELERDAAFEIERRHSKEGESTQFKNPDIRRSLEDDWKRIQAAPETAIGKLRKELSELNIAQCAWRSITWESPAPKSRGQTQ